MIFCVLNFKTLSFFPELCFSNASDGYKIKLDKRVIKSEYPGCFQSTATQFVRARVEIKSNSSVREGKKVQKTFVVDKKVNCFQFIYIGHKYKLNRIVSARCEYCHTRKKAIIQINCVLDITLNINIQFRKNILPLYVWEKLYIAHINKFCDFNPFNFFASSSSSSLSFYLTHSQHLVLLLWLFVSLADIFIEVISFVQHKSSLPVWKNPLPAWFFVSIAHFYC